MIVLINFKNTFERTFNSKATDLKSIPIIKPMIMAINIQCVKLFFKNMWQDIKNFFIEKFINPIKEHGLVGIVEAFGNLFIKICELIVKFTLYLEDKFVEICSSLFDIISEYAPKIFSFICEKIKDLWKIFIK
jgi:hypothetical protein